MDGTPRPRRVYKLRKKFRFTQARRAAAQANLAGAREVLRERGWPHSEAQRAAARENIKKAQAAIRAHGLPSTQARQAAMGANLAKANAVLREHGYPRNERQIEASCANLRKAWEASRDPANYARYHKHKLKHGLYARKLEELLLQYVELRAQSRAKGRLTKVKG